MTVYDIVFLIGEFVILLVIITTIKVLRNQKMQLEYDKLKSAEYIAAINTVITEDDFKLLDRFIDEVFIEYRILNIEFADIDHVNEELELKIQHELPVMVIDRVSRTFLDKLSIIYNTNADNIASLVLARCNIHILSYVLSVNKLKKIE